MQMTTEFFLTIGVSVIKFNEWKKKHENVLQHENPLIKHSVQKFDFSGRSKMEVMSS